MQLESIKSEIQKESYFSKFHSLLKDPLFTFGFVIVVEVGALKIALTIARLVTRVFADLPKTRNEKIFKDVVRGVTYIGIYVACNVILVKTLTLSLSLDMIRLIAFGVLSIGTYLSLEP